MSDIYLVADTHFSHRNITGPSLSSWTSGYRDFDSIEDMNNAIVSSINDNVKEDDILYHLGDWSFGGIDKVWEFRKQLKVKNIYLALGNHDRNIWSNKDLWRYFTSVRDVYGVKLNGHYFWMSHYAHKVWPHSHHGSIHLFGHSHHTLPDDGTRSMDVGWCLYRRPLHIDEVIQNLSSRPIRKVDHHTTETN